MRMGLRRGLHLAQVLIGSGASLLLVVLISPVCAQLHFAYFPPVAQAAKEPDPIPLRRVQVPPNRVLLELERAHQGAFVHLTRAEFERRVQQARDVGEALKRPPRLLEARYRAALEGMSLAGSAKWTITNRASIAGVLPLQPFNLALRGARLDKTSAILGDLDGKALGLLIEPPGQHILALDWSARGEPGPGGLHFRLEVPPCALTSFELELPADRELVAVLDRVACFLSGPQSLGTSNRRLWRLECPEASPIDLLIRPTSGSGQPGLLVLASLQARQNLEPGQLTADFDFNLESLHGSIRDLIFDCDPLLRPLIVSVRNLPIETWELRPGSSAGARSTLRVRLPQPVLGKVPLLRVHCLTPVLPGQPWHSPGLHLVGAIPRGERLSLKIAPELELHDWQPGYFDLLNASSDPSGVQILTLQSGLHDPGATHRPSAVVKLQESETKVRELTWWQIQADGASLTAQLNYEVLRGQLFRLAVEVPPGWQVDRVDIAPAGLSQNWSVVPSSKTNAKLLVDLQSPLKSPGSARLTIEFRPQTDKPALGAETIQPFPIVLPLNQIECEAGLAISIDPSHQGVVKASAPTSLPPMPRERGGTDSVVASPESPILPLPPLTLSAWNARPPDYYYTYRGKPVTGTLQLLPRPARLYAHCDSEVILAPGRAALRTRLLLEPAIGSVDTIDLSVSAPAGDNWQWKSESSRNGVRAMQRLRLTEESPRLHILGAASPLEAISLFALPPAQRSVWRLTLAQPLREPLVLETTRDLNVEQDGLVLFSYLSALRARNALAAAVAAGTRQPAAASPLGRWEVPLLTVLSADRMTGEVRVHLAGADRVHVDAAGLREFTARAGDGGALPWRSFRYGHEPVSLILSGQIATADRLTVANAHQVHLTTYVEPSERMLNHFLFRVENWHQRTLPVQLPTNARLLAARSDGRWISQPDTVDIPGRNPVVALPVAAGTSTHLFEIIYVLDKPSWRLWAQLHSPVPGLPLPISGFRRTWYLPPGLAPVDESRYQRLPGTGETADDQKTDNTSSALSVLSSFGAFSAEEWKYRQQRLLDEGNARQGKDQDDPKSESLRTLVEDLVFEGFKGQEAVVVDGLALEEAGLQPASLIISRTSGNSNEGPSQRSGRLLRVKSLEASGVVCVACPPGPLLTTREQWDSWQASEGQNGQLAASVEEAVAQAVRCGQDSSGRFQRAAEWLSQHRTGLAYPAGLSTQLPRGDLWTAWEPRPGDWAEDTLIATRPATLSGMSWALLMVFLLAAWRARLRPGRGRYGVLVLWLGLAGMALLWLPACMRPFVWRSFLPGIAVACIWYLWSALRSSPGLGAPNPVAAGSAVLALAMVTCLPGQAAAPGPQTVLLLPGPDRAPDKESVLAPGELLEQLRSLARRGARGLQGAALLDAKYEGAVNDGIAEFKAEFQVQSFSDGSTSLTLPISGIELQEALLDGSTAYPVAMAVPLHAYSFQIKERGRHKVQVRFALRDSAAGAEHELRCAIPEIAQSQLKLRVPAGASYLRTVQGRGAQRTVADSKETMLEADLGRVNTLQVRWRQEKASPPSAIMRVNEVYVWDLRSSASSLHGVLQYSITQGAPTVLTLALPENAEVSQVRAAAVPGGSTVRHLKDWQVSGTKGRRILRLEFQEPITTSVQVYLDLVSSVPLAASVSLALPAPLDAAPSDTDSYLGYRVAGCKAEPIEFNRLTGIQPEEFNVVLQSAGIEDRKGPVERAYGFRRSSAGGPVLRLQLHLPKAEITCLQKLTWHVMAERATVQASAKLRSSRGQICLVEWEIPPNLAVTSISGNDVRSWSRKGAAIQVWLRRSQKETTLQLFGWTSRLADKPTELFRLPRLRLRDAASQYTLLHITSDSNLSFQATELQHLWTVPAFRPSNRDRTYYSQSDSYGASFIIKPATADPEVRVLTLVEMGEKSLNFNSTIDYFVPDGELHRLTVRLRNGQGAQVRLESGRVAARHERQLDSLNYIWTLDLMPGVTGHYPLKLAGVLSPTSAPEILMPDVSVDGAARGERLVATAGSDLVAEDVRGLLALPGTTRALQAWPQALEHLKQVGGSVWKVIAQDWQLRLHPRSPRTDVEPVRLVHDEYAATIRDGHHWSHEAVYWLFHEAGTDLGIALPAGAHLDRILLDGADVTPLNTEPDHLWLSLAGAGGIRCLSVSWLMDSLHESLERPNLSKPLLEDSFHAPLTPAGNGHAASGPPSALAGRNSLPRINATTSYWALQIPPGYHLIQARGDSVPDSPTGHELRRAAALLELSRELAIRGAEKMEGPFGSLLSATQEEFHRSCRYAQYRLALAEPGRDSSVLAAKLASLQRANKDLAAEYRFDAIRVLAENRVKSPVGTRAQANPLKIEGIKADGKDQGTPTYWRVTASSNGRDLRLLAVQVEHRQRTLALSGLLAMICLIAWLVTYSPRLVSVVQALWPEQIALAGYVGWQVFGPHIAFVILIFFGIAGRIFCLAYWASSMIARRATSASTMGGS